jgi:hypothetical protein
MNVKFNHKLAANLLNPWKLRAWMLRHLPMGFASGMVVEALDERSCRVMLKDRFWIRNPFGSVFWAVMGMAAEMSTGTLLYAWLSGTNIKFILIAAEGRFLKKLRGKSCYFCHSGQEVLRSIESLQNTGDTRTVVMPVSAKDKNDQIVAEFQFTWSLKIPEN